MRNSTKRTYDYLIVGAGLYGATFAHLASKAGRRCLVIDKRAHVGGNIYCENIEGIAVHRYGAHIFHTSNKMVWDFVNQFATFNRYTNCPVAHYRGRLYNLPFNMNTFYQMWGTATPAQAQEKIEAQKQDALNDLHAKGKSEPTNLEEQALLLVGKDIYETLIKGYTEKQWGRNCRALPPFIIKRLPVRFMFDNNYFNDAWQGIPLDTGEGYNGIINNLLCDVEIKTNADYFSDVAFFNSVADKTIFCGGIDKFYDFRFGKLEWRTLRFETEILETQNYQGCAVMNFCDGDVPYTRIIEHKHFAPENPHWHINKTVITKEYPAEWNEQSEPFYPINDEKNSNLYQKYKALAAQEKRIFFGGRLGEYKYYDMDDVIEKAMTDFEKIDRWHYRA